MAKRQSIHIEGFKHVNPIPNAARVGNTLMSGLIVGMDPAAGKVAPTLDEQLGFIFVHMKAIVEAGGGTMDDVVKVNVYLKDLKNRSAVNNQWLKAFPDEHTRPARHAHYAPMDGASEVQADFIAIID